MTGDTRYLELYAAESQEQLRTLSQALLTLERTGKAEPLEAAFRSAHSLKGMAAALGFDDVAALAHALEDQLAGLRDAPGAPAVVHMESLLRLFDGLELAVRGSATRAASNGAPGAGPSTVIRLGLARLDALSETLAHLGALHTRMADLAHAADPAGHAQLLAALEVSARTVGQLQDAVLDLRMVPLREVFDRLPRLVRDTARELGKEVELELAGSDIELDRAVLEGVTDALIHLLRNAVAHGIERPEARRAAGKPECGRVRLEAERSRSRVVMRVIDDGAGIDLARVAALAGGHDLVPADVELNGGRLLELLARPGFSTALDIDGVSGRGVGLNAVLERVRALGGTVDLTQETGRGSVFTLWLPITAAVTQALRVRVGGENYLIPLTHVREAVDLRALRRVRGAGGERVRVRGEALSLVRLRRVLNVPGRAREQVAVVAAIGERKGALAVDEVANREQVVIKGFAAPRGMLACFSGATLLADGRPALVLDPSSLLSETRGGSGVS
ncbi:MAG: chemotaxis protein CheA [Longimicrobiales bacterium]